MTEKKRVGGELELPEGDTPAVTRLAVSGALPPGRQQALGRVQSPQPY